MEVALASRTREREHPVDIDGAAVDQPGVSPSSGVSHRTLPIGAGV